MMYNDKHTSETVVRRSNHCKLHSLKTKGKKSIFQIGPSNPPLPRSSLSNVGKVDLCSSNWPKKMIKYAVDFIKSWLYLQLSGKILFIVRKRKSQPFMTWWQIFQRIGKRLPWDLGLEYFILATRGVTWVQSIIIVLYTNFPSPDRWSVQDSALRTRDELFYGYTVRFAWA